MYRQIVKKKVDIQIENRKMDKLLDKKIYGQINHKKMFCRQMNKSQIDKETYLYRQINRKIDRRINKKVGRQKDTQASNLGLYKSKKKERGRYIIEMER